MNAGGFAGSRPAFDGAPALDEIYRGRLDNAIGGQILDHLFKDKGGFTIAIHRLISGCETQSPLRQSFPLSEVLNLSLHLCHHLAIKQSGVGIAAGADARGL